MELEGWGLVRMIFIFYHFFYSLSPYLELCWLRTKIALIRLIGSVWGRFNVYEWGGNELEPKRSHAIILGEGVLRGQKHKICPFSSQSIENQKLRRIEKSTPPSQLGRKIWRFTLFLSLKSAAPSLSPFQT